MKKIDTITELRIDKAVFAAVEEARRDLHVEELHKRAMHLLDDMMSYLDTAEDIKKWQKLYEDAHTEYDNAEREARYVGERLRVKLLAKEGVDFWTGVYCK